MKKQKELQRITVKKPNELLRIFSAVLTLLAAFVFSACRIGDTEKPSLPVFEDGVYDGYVFYKDYQKRYNVRRNAYTKSLPSVDPDKYTFHFGIRNEENETEFADGTQTHLNVSYGYFENEYGYDLTQRITSYNIRIYLVNNAADVVDYDESGMLKFQFDGMTPAHTIDDFYSDEAETFNEKYNCVIKDGVNGQYIGFSYTVKIPLPEELFYFESENLTALAVVDIKDEEGREFMYYQNAWPVEAKVSYEKTDAGVKLFNYKQPVSLRFPQTGFAKDGSGPVDSLNYDGGDALVSVRKRVYGSYDDITVGKSGGIYFAKFPIDYSDDYDSYPLSAIRSNIGSWQYSVKKDGVIYYKLNPAQTYWRVGQDGINGVRDPETAFLAETDYKIEKYKAYYEKNGVSFSEPKVGRYMSENDSYADRWDFNYIHEVPSRRFFIHYYQDGWIKSIRDGYSDLEELLVGYYPGLGSEYLQIDLGRIETGPSIESGT